jgi:outer membrane protein OmpA-like peptidoglycan-associated protein
MTLTVIQEKPQSPDGTPDGAARLEIEGGQPDYRIAWDNGEREMTAVKMSEGEHSVTVTDENGCSASTTFQMTRSLAPIQVAYEQTQTSGCAGANENAIAIKVTGGKGPFQYVWNDPALSGPNPSNIPPGSYQVTVTDDLKNITNTAVTVQEPNALEAVVEIKAPATTDEADGQAQVNVTGGTEPYTYLWDNQASQILNTTLAAGRHSVTVTDAAGCSVTSSIDISEDILPLTVSIQERAKNKCFGDAEATLDIIIEGGKKPFSYAWSDPNMRGGHASGLAAGTYGLTVTDTIGNTGSVVYEVSAPEPLRSSINLVNPAGTNQKDGQAIAEVSGGTAPYTYLWDNGESNQKAVNLGAGFHALTITDQMGCEMTDSILIQENILPLAINVKDQKINCFGLKTGSIQLEVTGGKAPYSYQWNDPNLEGEQISGLGAGSYQVTISDMAGNTQSAKIQIDEPEELEAVIQIEAPASTGNADGEARIIAAGGTPDYSYTWSNGETAQTATTLSPGEHQVTITDAAGCTAVSSVVVEENILDLQATIELSEPVACFGSATAAIKVNTTGGKGPFRYQWNNPAWEGDQVSNLPSGIYQVTVTDAADNTQALETTVAEPEKLEASIFVEAPASTGNADGKARVDVKGGTPEYTFAWSNGETGQTALTLAPGAQEVTVTDGAGCTAHVLTEITENILPLQVSLEQTSDIFCSGAASAALLVNVTGGKEPYVFEWNDDGITGNAPTGLTANDYEVVVSDVTGTSKTAKITITEPNVLKAEITEIRPATDEASNDGKAQVVVSGGSGNYTYAWDQGSTGDRVDDLPMGDHTVTITDDRGCNLEVAYTIPKKILPKLTANKLRSGQVLKMESLQFDADSTTILPVSIPVLEELFVFMKDNSEIVIQVEGHTNGIPPHDFCDKLSTERAKKVAQYITYKGISGKRVYYKGYGKRKPLFSNETADGRRKNQRVEIRIMQLRDT